ncbi:MAG: tRNA (5-methylaminomethyl-2-thiouridine)(34)-methyltransferase MnmD [Candidatus Omnitrophica bacterium]|nr:tRNA (5-methylaminomethyl-2-thiouridine)(34)-methyltransferase MnmD [Candidatus Omnitrophota bacterium]
MFSNDISYTQLRWDENGLPHSVMFDDKYFCQESGYEEGLHVFCGGNHLEERFKKLSSTEPFLIGETGFGTGLNFLCAWQLFEQNAPLSTTLHYISIDQFPLNKQDLQRALSLWPQLKKYSEQLIEHYPSIGDEEQTIVLSDGRVKLSLIYDHVLKGLDQMSRKHYYVDAWFLDGFAPAKNEEMWSKDVFVGIGALSRPGTTIATFTSAGDVRRGLIEQGFNMEKAPGFGRKRHMLKGEYGGRRYIQDQ